MSVPSEHQSDEETIRRLMELQHDKRLLLEFGERYMQFMRDYQENESS